jgi:hypothetical protein
LSSSARRILARLENHADVHQTAMIVQISPAIHGMIAIAAWAEPG